MSASTNGIGARTKFYLFMGKTRRFFYGLFPNGYVKKQLENRQGECKRCGACCKLLFNCPFLDDSVTPCRCKIYGRTSANCRLFPLDERDLAERDLVAPDKPCGFYFKNGNGHGGNGRAKTGLLTQAPQAKPEAKQAAD